MTTWHPISTAPKADAVILVLDPKFGRCVASNSFGSPAPLWMKEHATWPHDDWYVVTEFDGDGDPGPGSVFDGGHEPEGIKLHPTLWQPLPDPPKE